jgi:hypothetical protein
MGLLFWAVLHPRKDRFINCWAACAIALATLSHIISALIDLVCISFMCLVPNFQKNQSQNTFLTPIASWLSTVMLGLAISAIYLYPALTSLDLINSQTITDKYLRLASFSFPIFTAKLYGIDWFTFQWPISVIAAITILVPLVYLLRVKQDNSLFMRGFWSVTLTGLAALFFSSELSYPLWILDLPLRRIQHPYRFIYIASISGIFMLCFVLEQALRKGEKRWGYAIKILLIALGIGSVAIFIKCTYLDGRPLPEALKTDQYTYQKYQEDFLISGKQASCVNNDKACLDYTRMAGDFKGLPEYALPTIGRNWLEFAQNGLKNDCAEKSIHCQTLSRDADGVRWQINNAEAVTIRLPLFDFPAWQVFLDKKPVPHQIDSETGVIAMELDKGIHTINVAWVRLNQEKIGLIISIASLLLWCFIFTYRKKTSALDS